MNNRFYNTLSTIEQLKYGMQSNNTKIVLEKLQDDFIIFSFNEIHNTIMSTIINKYYVIIRIIVNDYRFTDFDLNKLYYELEQYGCYDNVNQMKNILRKNKIEKWMNI